MHLRPVKAREATRSAKTREKPSTYLQVRGIPMRWRQELRRRAERKGVPTSRYLQNLLEKELRFVEAGSTAVISDAARRLPLRGRRTALQVRGVPRELRERVRRDAERRGLSLSQYVLGIIQEALAFPMFEEWVEELRRDPPVHLPKPAAEYLHEARRAEGWED